MVLRVMRDVKERCAEVDQAVRRRVAAERKAIRSFRLRLHDGLRQSGIPFMQR
jgi:hypothetical protein